MTDPEHHLSTLEQLTDDQAGLASLWSRMGSLLVENKHRCGFGHWTDRMAADNAERVFHALLRICVEAGREGLSQADRLAAFGWFLDACRTELERRPLSPMRH